MSLTIAPKTAQVLAYLKAEPNGCTVFEMQQDLNFGDIRKKISDLRKQYYISDCWIPYEYASGEKTKIKCYFYRGRLKQ